MKFEPADAATIVRRYPGTDLEPFGSIDYGLANERRADQDGDRATLV